MKTNRIVTIGGGTGLFPLLSGLKEYPVELSAIVTMADDGGSGGRLRDELGVLPPGDVRQCLVALSESSKEMRELMNYRFEEGSLRGHNFGNLLVSALEKVNGSLTKGIDEAAHILNMKGEVIPVSEGDMRLVAELENGKILHGEDELDENKELRQKGVPLKHISLKNAVKPNPKALKRIRSADVIVIGPGDQFGSILPNLLVSGVSRAIRDSKAKVIYVCALTNKRGLTQDWDLRKYVQVLEKYIGKGRIDIVIFNTQRIPDVLVRKYERKEGKRSVVKFNESEQVERRYKVVKANVLSTKKIVTGKGDVIASTRSFIRHDPRKLAQAIMMILDLERSGRVIKDIV